MAVVKLTTFSVEDENQNTITKWRCCSIEVSHYVPGTGRFSTGKMSPAETLRRISLREGQNTKPSLVSSFSESRHQYEESVGVYKAATKISTRCCAPYIVLYLLLIKSIIGSFLQQVSPMMVANGIYSICRHHHNSSPTFDKIIFLLIAITQSI